MRIGFFTGFSKARSTAQVSYSANHINTLFKNHESALESCWSLAFVKDLVKQDNAIYYFLRSNWKTSDRSYYFNFYANSEGGTSCQFNLPQVAKPSGTKYYCFENLIFYWDNDISHLTKCFRFEISSYNTIKVFCYKNNRTYTLYRQ